MAETAVETKRPKIIDRLILRYRQYNAAKEKFESLKKKATPLIEQGNFPEVRAIKSKAEHVDAKLAVKWLKGQYRSGAITKEQFKSFFVATFDINAFQNALNAKEIKRAALPEGTVYSKQSTTIRFFLND